MEVSPRLAAAMEGLTQEPEKRSALEIGSHSITSPAIYHGAPVPDAQVPHELS